MLDRLVLISFLVLHVLAIRFEFSTDLLRHWASIDGKILEKLMRVQWESRGYGHELEINLSKLTTRPSAENGVDIVIPGTLTEEDDIINFNWILTAAIEADDPEELYASLPYGLSAIESDSNDNEEIIKDLESMTAKIVENLFPNWEAKIWAQTQPLTKILRFQYWYLALMSGRIEAIENGAAMEIRPEDFKYNRSSESAVP